MRAPAQDSGLYRPSTAMCVGPLSCSRMPYGSPPLPSHGLSGRAGEPGREEERTITMENAHKTVASTGCIMRVFKSLSRP